MLKYETIKDNNVVDFIDNLFYDAITKKSSDIHIEPKSKYTLIRYRILGDLCEVKKINREYHSMIVTRIKIMAKIDISEKRLPQDGRITFKYKNKNIDLRISTICLIDGEKIVIRILDQERLNYDLEDIGFNKEDFSVLNSILRIKNKMLIVSGPTGCGKSTTLNAILKKINSPNLNIVAIENPVEIKIDEINQIQINEKAGIFFANTLRAVLRNDPDIIMIGEMRDNETAEIAVKSAITGHEVFSTLHNFDVYSAIIRLKDMGIENYLIASSLKGVIAQRLVKTLCDNCKIKIPKSDKDYIYLKNKLNLEYDFDIYKNGCCDKCNSGFTGRTGIFEILKIDNDFLESIMKNSPLSELKYLGNKKGIKNIYTKALELVLKGKITIEEANKVMIE